MFERRYIVARSRMDASNSALGWGWQRLSNDTYRDLAGNEVIYVESVNDLAQERRGRVIYLGFGHTENRALRNLANVALNLQFELRSDGKRCS